MTGLACHEWLLMLEPTLSCPHNINEGKNMSRFEKLTHVLWHCQYHIVWVPKYRYRVLEGTVGREVDTCLRVFLGQNGCECAELNVRPDHAHSIAMVPPKKSISHMMGILKGRSAIRIFKRFPCLKRKPLWSKYSAEAQLS